MSQPARSPVGRPEAVLFAERPALQRTSKHAFRKGWAWGYDVDRWFEQETSRLDLARPFARACADALAVSA